LLSVVLFVCVAQCSMIGPLKLAASGVGAVDVVDVAEDELGIGLGLPGSEQPATCVLISTAAVR
jgi:hypothetical protein